MKPTRTYHHGDLRQALVSIAVAQVRAAGMQAFSLREAARESGVTSGAAYKHFADKDDLLAAVAVEGFRLLAVQTLAATGGSHGRARLLAVGRAYIAFASREPHLFRLMFSSIGPARVAKAGEPTRSDDGPPDPYSQLRAAVADARGVQPDAVVEDDLALAWSVAHGAACLISDGVWRSDDPRAEAALQQTARVISGPAIAGPS